MTPFEMDTLRFVEREDRGERKDGEVVVFAREEALLIRTMSELRVNAWHAGKSDEQKERVEGKGQRVEGRG